MKRCRKGVLDLGDLPNQSNSQKQIDFENLDFESKQNLVGFFDLLLKIDMRINPDLYKEDYQSSKEQKV